MDKPSDAEIDWARIRPRRIADADWKRFEGYLREIFSALGMPEHSPGTTATPRRFLRAMLDATDGYEGDPKLITAFPNRMQRRSGLQVQPGHRRPIPFFSLCEHHALPFFGHAWVGYVAHDNILWISKLTRIVRLFTQRFSVQERIGREIADLIERMMEPHGVAAICRPSTSAR